MRYRSGEPPLPSDVMPEERDDEGDDPGGDLDHAGYLRAAHYHAKESARHLRKALDLLDDEPLGGPDDDDDEPTDFAGDNVPPNPQDRRARMRLVANLLQGNAMRAIKRSIQSNTVKSVDAEVGPRQVLAIVSSERRDRVGDVIKQGGIDYADFMRLGGTVLYQHDSMHPVARTIRMGLVNGNLTALTQFPVEGTSEKSDECYRLIREGVVNSCSIGFIPEEYEFLDKNRSGSGILFKQVQLLEFSYVSVPANPSAAIIAKSYPSIYRQQQQRTAPRPTTWNYSGTAEMRKWMLNHEHPEIERDAAEAELAVALLAVDTSTWEGRQAYIAAHKRYAQRMGWNRF